MRFGATPERYTSHAQSNIVAFGPPSFEHFEQSRARCHVALWVKMLLLCQCRQFFCNLCTFCFQIAREDQNSNFVVFPHVIPNLQMMRFTVGWFQLVQPRAGESCPKNQPAATDQQVCNTCADLLHDAVRVKCVCVCVCEKSVCA